MSNFIEKAFVQSYKAGFTQAFQQSDSRFRQFVEVERQEAEFDYYDRVGLADDMAQVTTRYGDNPINEIDHNRRRIQIRDYELGKPIDEKDLERVAMDPTHAYTTAMVASANRKVDDIIVTGLTATAYTDKTGSTAVNFVGTTSGKVTIGAVSDVQNNFTAGTYLAKTAGNYEGIDIAVDYTGTTAANAGLTLAKLKAIREAMLGTDAIDQDTVINMLIGRKQLTDLLGINEVINSDFNAHLLAEGKVSTFMGIRFKLSNRLPLAGSSRACFAFLPQAFKLAIGKDIKVDMWRLTGQKNIPYIYLSMGLGGSRMWGEVLAKVNCYEV